MNTETTMTIGEPAVSEQGEMDAATLEALKGSIAKWEGVVAGTVEENGPDNCPLCQKFYEFGSGGSCIGCPVMAATGLKYCEGSPYDDYDADTATAADLARAAQAELDFLKSLLPDAAELSKGEKL